MAVKNNLTIFQRLGQVVNPENIRPTQAQPQANTQRYNIGSDVLLKTDNKADFDRIKLQQQQNKFLANQCLGLIVDYFNNQSTTKQQGLHRILILKIWNFIQQLLPH
jgi:hypothetical protein